MYPVERSTENIHLRRFAEIIFRIDLAATIEPLPLEAEALLNEFVGELQARDPE